MKLRYRRTRSFLFVYLCSAFFYLNAQAPIGQCKSGNLFLNPDFEISDPQNICGQGFNNILPFPCNWKTQVYAHGTVDWMTAAPLSPNGSAHYMGGFTNYAGFQTAIEYHGQCVEIYQNNTYIFEAYVGVKDHFLYGQGDFNGYIQIFGLNTCNFPINLNPYNDNECGSLPYATSLGTVPVSIPANSWLPQKIRITFTSPSYFPAVMFAQGCQVNSGGNNILFDEVYIGKCPNCNAGTSAPIKN